MQEGSDYLAGIEWSGWPVEDAHRRHSDPRRQSAGYIYVLESSDGWIKVGCANNARSRIRAHAKEADLRGARILCAYVSRPHKGWRENEQELIAHCTRRKRPSHGREYFRGIKFADAMAFAESLRQELPTAEDLAEAERRAGAFVKAFKEYPQYTAKAKSGNSAERWAAWAQGKIAAMFGRKDDGSYNIGSSPIADDPATPQQAEALFDMLVQIAEANGGCVECALEMTTIDVLEDVISNMVKIEAARLYAYATEHGHANMVTPGGDLIRRALPEGDPRLIPSHAPAEDEDTYWDYDPEQGMRRWEAGSDEPVEIAEPPRCWR